MKVEEMYLRGCFVLTPLVFEDERGYFFESFNKKTFEEKTGVTTNFVQANQSKSSRGILRGMHFQTGEFAQAKLVQVLRGKVLDVCTDIRRNSPTFGNSFSIILDDIEHRQVYIPRGFAHGFLALEDDTVFSYKCDNFYNKVFESGIVFNDEDLNIEWGFPLDKLIISEKDKQLPSFKDFVNEY